MNISQTVGKYLIFGGAVLIFIGAALIFFDKIPFFRKLPGDILIKKHNVTIYFPIVTCLIISAILSLIAYLMRK